MRNIKIICTSFAKLLPLLLLLHTACSSPPKIIDYISLPPPDNVQAATVGQQVEITWELPQLPSSQQITGFNIYLSRRSLMYTALTDLPEPDKTTGKDETRALIPFPQLIPAVFIHVRSTNNRGDLSLPSLPEVRLEVGRVVEKKQ